MARVHSPVTNELPTVSVPDALSDSAGQKTDRRTSKTLPLPETAQPLTAMWSGTVVLGLLHLFALLAVIPWLFSWTGLVLAVVGHFVFGMLGITVGYHRLLTHQGFTCPKWLEHTLATLGVCCLQDSPARWVAVHRMHHQHSDEQPDPHSPLVGMVWGHFGWVLSRNREHDHVGHFERYVRDLLRDPFYFRLERKGFWLMIYLAHAAMFFVAGLAYAWITTGSFLSGLQFGLSLLVWGVFVRTVFVLHGTWSVNSAAHLWGYRNYDTSDNSRNNFLVALLTHGEGWHNNHHADQRSIRHGHRWWEFDMSYRIIRLLEMLGLAHDLKLNDKSPE